MSERTQQVVFWPGIYKDIEKKRAECEACTRNAPSQSPLPPTPVASPEYPFQMIVMDYCNVKGKAWLVIADRFTGWVSVYYFAKEATTQQLIEILRTYFSTFGICVEIATDNGSQYRAKRLQISSRSGAWKDTELVQITSHIAICAQKPLLRQQRDS